MVDGGALDVHNCLGKRPYNFSYSPLPWILFMKHTSPFDIERHYED